MAKIAVTLKWWWLLPIAVVAIGAILMLYNPKPTPAVFNFNDGTTQGWTFDGVYDDAGKKYNGTTFPPTALKNHQGQELCFFPNQLGLYLNELGFSKTSQYWRVDLVSPNLGPAWNGMKGLKASIRDQIGMENAVLEATLFVRVDINGSKQEIPVQGTFQPSLPHDSWQTVSQNMNIPSGAYLLNLIVRLRGQWATPGSTVIQLYEGQVYVDDVTKLF